MAKFLQMISCVFGIALAIVPALCAQESVTFPSLPDPVGRTTQLGGYLYRPNGPGPFPAVVMLHGCSGLLTRSGKIASNARFWAEHLRAHGYVALLVDSFTPRGIDEVCTGRHNLSVVHDRANDARSALQFVRQHADVQADRVGLAGWSNGAGAVPACCSVRESHSAIFAPPLPFTRAVCAPIPVDRPTGLMRRYSY